MRLADPLLLLLGLLFLPFVVRRVRPHLGYSNVGLFDGAPWIGPWARLPDWATGIAIALLLTALARPQWGQVVTSERREARDIIVAVDLSGSMQGDVVAGEGKKIDAAKEAVLRFLGRRQGDRVGLLVFGNDAYGSWPLSSDLSVVRQKVHALEADLGGTDLAKPLRRALAHLQEVGQSEARAIILVTDGEAPIAADIKREIQAKLAAMNVHLYLLGIDLPESADVIDLVARSGGRVWRVNQAEDLWGAFQDIDRLEPSAVTVETRRVHRDLYPWFTLGGLAFLGAAVAGATLAPRIP